MAKKPSLLAKDKKSRQKALERRKALSMEDVPLEEYEREEEIPHLSLPKPLVRALAIVLACGLVVFLWVNRANLAPDRVGDWIQDSLLGMGVGSGFPVPLVGTDIAKDNFQIMGQDAVMVSDTSFVMLNKTAKELCNRQHSFSTPVLKVGGSQALIFNLGGNAFQIESRSKNILKRDELEDNILAGNISASGNYAIVTEAKGYFSRLTVYAKNSLGQEDDDYLYRYSFSDYYITNVALNSSGNSVAATGITASDGALKSALYLFDDFQNPDPKEEPDFEFPDNVILAVSYLNNGFIAVVGDQQVSVINPDTKEKIDYSYRQRTLASFELKEDGILLALSQSNDGRACDLVLLSTDGSVTGEFPTDKKVLSVSRKGESIALLAPGEISMYSKAGERQGTWDAGSDARKMELYAADEAYVLGISEIRSVALH